MKHLAMLQDEFIKIAVSSDWWSKLTRDEQIEYIKNHRKTKNRVNQGFDINNRHDRLNKIDGKNVVKTLFAKAPKVWKQIMSSKGVTTNSEVSRVELKPKNLNKLFETNNIIVGFDVDTKKPAFIISRNDYDDKFTARTIKNDTDVNMTTTKYKPTVEYSSGKRRRGPEQPYQTTSLRMSDIVEKLQDKPYMIYGLSIDDDKSKLQSQRHQQKITNDTVNSSEHIKPAFDFYNERYKKVIDSLSKRMPTLDSLKQIEGSKNNNEDLINELQLINRKLDALRYSLRKLNRASEYKATYKDFSLQDEQRGNYKKENLKKYYEEVKNVQDEINKDKLDYMSKTNL